MMRRIYAQHAELGNRVGLHYSHFWPKSKMPLPANQLLNHRKKLKIRIFERESANSG